MSLNAMKQALEALETVVVDVKTTPNAYEASRQAITALRAAIEQAQKPVAWFTVNEINEWAAKYLEKHPEQETRQWQGLTHEEIESITADNDYWDHHTSTDFARTVEALLKAKNS